MSRLLFSLSMAGSALALVGAGAVGAPADTSRIAAQHSASGTVVRALPRFGGFSLAGRAALTRVLSTGESGTYIAEILGSRDSTLARWPDRHGKPLRVWIQPTAAIDDWHPELITEVRNAFMAWDAVQLPVRFAVTTDSADADVHVRWTDHFAEPISGRTRWTRDDHYWITDASITLAVHHRTGEALEDDAMHAMALHEIGHLLGLDHTADSTSVMAPRVRVRSLSAADRATARLLYSLPAGRYSSR